MVLDVDNNGRIEALTDGIAIVRYLFGLTGEPLIQGAVAEDANRSSAQEIVAYLDSVRDRLDIDGNGTVEALTDGILTVRHLFGLTGEPLIQGAVASDATLTAAAEIEAYLESIENALALPVDPETGAQYFPGELLLKLAGDVTATEVGSLAESFGAIAIEPLVSSDLQPLAGGGQWYVAKFESDTDLQETRNSLAADPNVEDVELDYLLSINFVPNDPDFNRL